MRQMLRPIRPDIDTTEIADEDKKSTGEQNPIENVLDVG